MLQHIIATLSEFTRPADEHSARTDRGRTLTAPARPAPNPGDSICTEFSDWHPVNPPFPSD